MIDFFGEDITPLLFIRMCGFIAGKGKNQSGAPG
jgi:hypothetical protein